VEFTGPVKNFFFIFQSSPNHVSRNLMREHESELRFVYLDRNPSYR